MQWDEFRQRAKSAKEAQKATDVDIAAALTDVLGYSISRAKVNHWLNRADRPPNVYELVELCKLLKVEPGEMLADVGAFHARPEPVNDYRRQLERVRRFKSKRRKARILA